MAIGYLILLQQGRGLGKEATECCRAFSPRYRTIPAAILIAASRLFSEAFPVPARLYAVP